VRGGTTRTLGQTIIGVIAEIAPHAGHADILRAQATAGPAGEATTNPVVDAPSYSLNARPPR